MTDTLKGKTALVTGGTFGIGRETALGLLRLGARVIIVGRDPARTAAAEQWLRARAGTDALLGTECADLSSLAEVAALAERLRRRCAVLDVLVNNAGGLFPQYRQSADGYEQTWALNHLGYFALTLQLLEPLRAAALASGQARVVNVASKLHKRAGSVYYDAQWDRDRGRGYRGRVAYARSKLGNILFTYGLSRRLKAEGITVNCVSPGIVGSGLNRHMPLPVRLMAPLFNRIALSPEEGARTSLYAAASAEVAGRTGVYFYRNAPIESSAETYDAALQDALWQLSLGQTGLADPLA